MPDWTGSFHKPYMTTEQFLKERDKYVAKYGYRYSIPGFNDIIHFGIEKPITEEETKIWASKRFSRLSPERYEELKSIKERRKEKYLDMLGSPTPQIFKSRGALIGSIDDAQDALSVLAITGAVAIRTTPAAISKFLAGPVGWTMTASEFLNFFNTTLTPERGLVKFKLMIEEEKDLNPMSKKAKCKRAYRIRKAKFGQQFAVEALQVTDNIFGIGISLGAVMNLPADIIFGAARRAMGKRSVVNFPIPKVPDWKVRAWGLMKSIATSFSAGPKNNIGGSVIQLIASNAAAQQLNYDSRSFNVLDKIDDILGVEIEAPKPKNILSIEAIQEIDPEGLSAIQWPTTGERWSSVADLTDTLPKKINETYKYLLNRDKHTVEGFIAGINATEATLHMLEASEGKGSVFVSHTADTKAITGLLNAGYTFPKNMTDAQFQRWKLYTDSYERQGLSPTVERSMYFAENIAGFSFVKIHERYPTDEINRNKQTIQLKGAQPVLWFP